MIKNPYLIEFRFIFLFAAKFCRKEKEEETYASLIVTGVVWCLSHIKVGVCFSLASMIAR